MNILRVTIVLILSTFVVLATPADAALPKPEGKMLVFINNSRADYDLHRLSVAARLNNIAETNSRRMANTGDLFHSGVIPSGCIRWGENVGVTGGSLWGLHKAFMDSPLHRANILGKYNQVGIGIVKDSGLTWATIVFCHT